jgi:hypothetical protein
MFDNSREDVCSECDKPRSQWPPGDAYRSLVDHIPAPMLGGAKIAGHPIGGLLCPKCAGKYRSDGARDAAIKRHYAAGVAAHLAKQAP